MCVCACVCVRLSQMVAADSGVCLSELSMFIKEKQLYLRALDGLVLPQLITGTCVCD